MSSCSTSVATADALALVALKRRQLEAERRALAPVGAVFEFGASAQPHSKSCARQLDADRCESSAAAPTTNRTPSSNDYVNVRPIDAVEHVDEDLHNVSSAKENDGDSSALDFKKTFPNSIITNASNSEKLECNLKNDLSTVDISRIIRKYCSPNIGMLKTGEYSPNNPELAGDGRYRGGDVFLGLGLYEEKRKKFLQKRRNEYQEYLAKQKEKSSKNSQNRNCNEDKRIENEYLNYKNYLNNYTEQRRPSSVAVQTDPEEIFKLTSNRKLDNVLITEAEKELSPRTSFIEKDNNDDANWKMLVEKVNIGTQNNLIVPPSMSSNAYYSKVDVNTSGTNKKINNKIDHLNNYIDNFNDINSNIFRKDSPRARLLQDLKHTYIPSLFYEEVIRQRNSKIEEEATARRVAYQLELKKQIEEQQRIREERKAREKLLDEAETRRLEEQLRMLKLAQEKEIEKQKELSIRMRVNADHFEQRKVKLQNEIDDEKNKKNNKNKAKESASLKSASDKPVKEFNIESKASTAMNYCPSPRSNQESDIDLLSYNAKRNNPFVGQDMPSQKPQFSTNIPDNSIFSQSIPIRNYNYDNHIQSSNLTQRVFDENKSLKFPKHNNLTNTYNRNKPNYEPAFLNKRITDMIDIAKKDNSDSKLEDSLPIPVLKEPDVLTKYSKINEGTSNEQNSEAMKRVEEKWQVPAVQKNILKNNFTGTGKQENILTQLGSIRKQLQLEQLKFDRPQVFP